MNPSGRVWLIFMKELRESLRDRKTLVVMVLLPMLLYPLLFLGLSTASLAQHEKMAVEPIRIGVAGPVPAVFADRLNELSSTTVVSSQDLEGALSRGDIDAALRFQNPIGASDPPDSKRYLELLFDGGRDLSRVAKDRLEALVVAASVQIQDQRLRGRGLSRDFIEPFKVSVRNVAPPARQGGWLLGQVLPMIICLLMIGATFYPAIDLTAGEKERGTLQTLLTAPVSPMTIVMGKYMAVVALATLTALVNLGSIAMVLASIPLPGELSSEVSFDIGPRVFFLVLLCLVMIGMVFGALMMAVAVTARSFKEAQNYLTPLYLLCVFPLMVTSLPGVGLDEVTALIPVVNIALTIKQLLVGDGSLLLFLEVILSTLAWMALALLLAARVFHLESVLLGDEGFRAVFQRRASRVPHTGRLRIGESVLLLGTILLGLFYGGILMRDWSLLAQIHATQWGLILAPTLALMCYLKVDVRQSLALARPPLWSVLSALLLGSGLWFVAGSVMEGWGPTPTPEMVELERQLRELGGAGGDRILLFAGVALAPALCEEFLFRGVVLGALRTRLNPWAAVLITATLFAIFHLNVYQFPTTFVVGTILGFLTLRSGSIFPAILVHLSHNAAALLYELNPVALSDGVVVFLVMAPVLGLLILVSKRENVAV